MHVLFVTLIVETSVQAEMLFNAYHAKMEIISLMENVFKNVQMGILLIILYFSVKNAILHVPSAVEVKLIIALSVI